MIRFYLFLFIVMMQVPVFAQTGQDTTIKTLPDTPPVKLPVIKDTTHKLVKPAVHQAIPVKDSTVLPDTLAQTTVLPVELDTMVSRRPLFIDTSWQVSNSIPIYFQVLERHPYFNFKSVPAIIRESIRQFHGKETLFYAMAGFLLLFALIKQGFGKYFHDLFIVFFRSTLKQRQMRDQLMQSPLPSLVFNFFFVVSAGLYIDFLLQHFNLMPVRNFWLLYLYCCIALAVIYLVKFIGLKLTGWLFNMKRAADSYSFIVFSINKIIGIFLLPFPIILAFTSDPTYTIGLVLSWCGIGALLLYRLILGFGAIRNEVRFNLFHFFLYLCAFEIAPLLLIYKLLLLVF